MQTPMLLTFLCKCGCRLCILVRRGIEGIGHLSVCVQVAKGSVNAGHDDDDNVLGGVV